MTPDFLGADNADNLSQAAQKEESPHRCRAGHLACMKSSSSSHRSMMASCQRSPSCSATLASCWEHLVL